jgi:hypothetical protein
MLLLLKIKNIDRLKLLSFLCIKQLKQKKYHECFDFTELALNHSQHEVA